jgi:hypothetical protein
MRDLPAGQADTDALLAANAQRESAFLVKIKDIATPADGLAALLDAADQSTIAVAAKVKGDAADKAKAKDRAKDNNGRSQGANPTPQPKK